ncbi:MAG: DUF2993 domain-containing protein [Micrococcales bacterium]|nr:DUF2993 domain-containing protein [Micrococcales bacterium]
MTVRPTAHRAHLTAPRGESGAAATVWIVVGAVVAVLLGVGFVCDQYLRHEAEQEVATQVAAAFAGMDDPAVTIHGIPFLTQMLSGKLKHVTGTTDEVVFDGLSATDVKVDAHDVTMSPARARSATVSATIDVSTAQKVLRTRTGIGDLGLRVDDDHLVVTTDLYGRELAIVGTVSTHDGLVQLDLGQASLAGQPTDYGALPSHLRNRLDRLAIPVSGMPEGVALNGAKVVDGGVRFTASGTDIPLTRSIARR